MLTSTTPTNANSPLAEIYPCHFQALGKAGLLPSGESSPTLSERRKSIEDSRSDLTSNKLRKRRARDCSRTIYFMVGFTDFWHKPIHKMLNNIKAAFPSLKWLCISMSYHWFQNFREGDLNTKILEDVTLLNFEQLPCNCRKKDKCIYNGNCRSKIVVYQATCALTGKKYVGNTQQPVKTRIQQHLQDTRCLFLLGKKSDSFANHFCQMIPPQTDKKQESQGLHQSEGQSPLAGQSNVVRENFRN